MRCAALHHEISLLHSHAILCRRRECVLAVKRDISSACILDHTRTVMHVYWIIRSRSAYKHEDGGALFLAKGARVRADDPSKARDDAHACRLHLECG